MVVSCTAVPRSLRPKQRGCRWWWICGLSTSHWEWAAPRPTPKGGCVAALLFALTSKNKIKQDISITFQECSGFQTHQFSIRWTTQTGSFCWTRDWMDQPEDLSEDYFLPRDLAALRHLEADCYRSKALMAGDSWVTRFTNSVKWQFLTVLDHWPASWTVVLCWHPGLICHFNPGGLWTLACPEARHFQRFVWRLLDHQNLNRSQISGVRLPIKELEERCTSQPENDKTSFIII